MVLARSASGPGGLSINSSSANSLFGSTSATPAAGGMFGNTQPSKPLFGAAASTTATQAGGLFGSAATTASQPAGGLFGTATTSQPQTGGLFGSTATTSQPQAGGLFGSAATTSQPQAGGLFGSTAASTQPATGGLFGSAPATSQAQPGGLFGSAQQGGGGLFGSTNMSQPASTGGLFGSSTATSQPQAAGGLFGGLGSQPAQNQTQNTGGGLFGGSTTQQTQGGGLFGGLNTQSKPAGTLFGLGSNQNQNQQSQQQQPSLFSSTQNPAQQPLGGSFMSNQQQQTTVPGVRIDLANIKGSTRINDLHDDLQKQMELIETVILGSQQHMRDCEAMMPKHEEDLNVVPADVEFCTRKLNGLTDLMEGDAQAVAGLKTLIEEDAAHAKLSFMGIDNLKLPPQYHTPGHWPTKPSSGDRRSQGNGSRDGQDIVGYFSSTADELSSKLANYQKNISEIESHLRGVEVSTAQQIHTYILRKNGGAAAQSDQIQELAESLQDFERGILNVAGKVGSAREGVQSLQLGGFMGPTNGGEGASARRSNVY